MRSLRAGAGGGCRTASRIGVPVALAARVLFTRLHRLLVSRRRRRALVDYKTNNVSEASGPRRPKRRNELRRVRASWSRNAVWARCGGCGIVLLRLGASLGQAETAGSRWGGDSARRCCREGEGPWWSHETPQDSAECRLLRMFNRPCLSRKNGAFALGNRRGGSRRAAVAGPRAAINRGPAAALRRGHECHAYLNSRFVRCVGHSERSFGVVSVLGPLRGHVSRPTVTAGIP